MPSKRQLKEEKQRKQKELAALLKQNKRLKEQGLFGPSTEIKKRKDFKPDYTYSQFRRNEDVKISSVVLFQGTCERKELHNRYSGEMAEREEQALKEIERRKKTVVPVYNKGPYQPISTKQQARDAGKKNPD